MQQRHYITVLAVCFGSVCLVLGFAAILTWNQAVPARNANALPVAENRRLLLSTLEGLHRTWVSSERESFLAPAREQRHAIETALHWFFGLGKHDRTPEALDLCAALALVEFRPEVAAIATSGREPVLRARALRVADSLSPWTTEQLAGFLRSDESAVLRAALGLARDRAARPTGRILELLVHPDREVRELALAALPSDLSADEGEILLGLARDSWGASGTTILRALGRFGLDSEVEELLCAKLGEPASLGAREAVLGAFGARGASLSPQSGAAVRAVFDDGSEPEGLRAKALYCLELTGRFDVVELERQLPVLPPQLKYYAARCLLSAGRASGGEALLELCDAGEAEGVGTADARLALAVRHATRVLFSELTQTQVSAGRETWATWLEDHDGHRMDLPPPRLRR